MSKNAARINAGIRALAHKPFEIISGTVVSIDASQGTMTVQPSDDSEPIEGVRLTAITGTTDGWIAYPDTDSHVVIGCIDGPGEWILLKASKLTKIVATIGHVSCEMNDTKVTITNNNTILDMSSSVFKIKTASESLFDIINDLITQINLITVATSGGPSGVPNNATAFSAIATRLGNLLTH